MPDAYYYGSLLATDMLPRLLVSFLFLALLWGIFTRAVRSFD